MLVLLLLGVTAPIMRHLFIFTLGIATPGYSQRRDFLSELSAIDAPYAIVMGLFGIGVVALMMIAAAIGLERAAGGRPLGRLTAFLVGSSGVGFIIVALAPCDPGCVAVEPSLRMQLHLLGGSLGMGAEVVAALAFGVGGIVSREQPKLSVISVALGIGGILSLALLFTQPAWIAGNVGFVQRITQGSGDLWLLLVCLSYALAGRSTPTGR